MKGLTSIRDVAFSCVTFAFSCHIALAHHMANCLPKKKNAELEPKHQMYKGRAVLRGDIVKDDSGACCTYITEQGSSASQLTTAKGDGRHCETT